MVGSITITLAASLDGELFDLLISAAAGQKAVRYGCERVDLESGGTISKILAGNAFPYGLSKDQEDTVKEAVGWCANHMLCNGLD